MIELKAGSSASRRCETLSGPSQRVWVSAFDGEGLRRGLHSKVKRGNSTAQKRYCAWFPPTEGDEPDFSVVTSYCAKLCARLPARSRLFYSFYNLKSETRLNSFLRPPSGRRATPASWNTGNIKIRFSKSSQETPLPWQKSLLTCCPASNPSSSSRAIKDPA